MLSPLFTKGAQNELIFRVSGAKELHNHKQLHVLTAQHQMLTVIVIYHHRKSIPKLSVK
jgi:hypothetical protein